MGYAGYSNTHQDRPHAGIKDNPPNYYSFAATYVGPYENKGNGQVVVTRTTDGKNIALDGKNANGQIEIYVKRVLSDEGYNPNKTDVNKISALIIRSMRAAGIAIKARKR